MSNSISTNNAMAFMAGASPYGNGSRTTRSGGGNWFEGLAHAWGSTLDRQASEIEGLANKISSGDDKPAVITELTAQSLRMGFLSTSAHTAISAAGEALKTAAQK